MLAALASVGFIHFMLSLLHMLCVFAILNGKKIFVAVAAYWVTLVYGFLWILVSNGYNLTVWMYVTGIVWLALIGVVASIVGFFLHDKGRSDTRKRIFRLLLLYGSLLFAILWNVTNMPGAKEFVESQAFSTKDLQSFWLLLFIVLIILGLAIVAKSKKQSAGWVTGIVFMGIAALILIFPVLNPTLLG